MFLTKKSFGRLLGQKSSLGLKIKYIVWGVRLRGRMYHFLLVTYHSIVNKNKIRGQFIFWVFIAIFRKITFLAIYTKMTKCLLKNQRSQNQV
jgi:hypothetical protein